MDVPFTKPFQNRLAHSLRTLSSLRLVHGHDRHHENKRQRIFGQKKGSNIEGQLLENQTQIELLLPGLVVLCNDIEVIASPMRGRITKGIFYFPTLASRYSRFHSQIERFVRNQHSSKDIFMSILPRTLFSFQLTRESHKVSSLICALHFPNGQHQALPHRVITVHAVSKTSRKHTGR